VRQLQASMGSLMKNKSAHPSFVTLDELFKVLCFYADNENYCFDDDGGPARIVGDAGRKARKILKKLVKEELNRAGIENNL